MKIINFNNSIASKVNNVTNFHNFLEIFKGLSYIVIIPYIGYNLNMKIVVTTSLKSSYYYKSTIW
jgi:hypothetical protein